jgi:Heparinase II/III-like protein
MHQTTSRVQRIFTLWPLALLLIGAAAHGAERPAERAATKPIPYNVAEAIVDPFWSPPISTLDLWTVEDTGNGAAIEQNWCWADYQWLRPPAEGAAFQITRTTPIACGDYDTLVVSIAAPPGARVRMLADTDTGPLTHTAPPATNQKAEVEMDLQGAALIHKLTLEVHAEPTGAMSGWINWVGLRSTDRLKVYLDRWKRQQDVDWSRYLKPESYRPTFEPLYGIALSVQELEALRQAHRKQLEATGESAYTQRAAGLKKLMPEHFISEFAMGGGDHRYNDVRGHDHPQYRGSEVLMAALVLRDEDLLRLAARYALSLAMCEHWVEGFVCEFPGSDFEHRAFLKNNHCRAIALMLDLAGDVFTEAGTLFLQRRLAEEGLGTINYVMWRYEYIHHCNQVAYFSPGRVYAYLVLENDWPRVKPYTKLALDDVVNNLKNAIETDGGCVEGPSYLAPTIRENFRAISYYARAREREVFDLVPDNLKKMGDFAAVIASTTPENDVIPVCDASGGMSIGTSLILSSILPRSYWVTMAHKALDRDGTPTDSLNQRLLRTLPPKADGPTLPAFLQLPVTGHMASTRRWHDQLVKILIVGNRKNAGHAHEDKGSFVLEFAGDTFAVDPGTCSYSSPLSNEYGTCQRHSMLVPVGPAITERPGPPHTLPYNVYPTGRGDEESFEATIDASPGWEKYYEMWTRRWSSPTPEILRIHDRYKLSKGSGVEFYWQTQLPVEVNGHEVTVTGRQGLVTLSVPKDCTVRIDELPLYQEGVQTRIAICKPGKTGEMTITARLRAK